MNKIFLLIVSFLVLSFSTGCNVEELKDKIVGEFVDYASPLVETTSKPSDPSRVLPPNPEGCPQWEKDTPNEITESIILPTGCKYDRVSLLIENQSDITLDCNGAEFNGINKEFRQAVGVPYSEADEPVAVGITIASYETISSQNITIKNCKVRNFLTGIAVLTFMTPENHSDLKNNINTENIENHLRDNSLKNIILENNTVNYSHRNGIFIGRYITGLVVDRSTVKYTSGAGLYLESGTQNNIIKNSEFSENGHSLYSLSQKARRKIQSKDTREGIAIDSSAMNTIQNNIFSKNAGGGVFIYKNCYENYQTYSELPRNQSADANLIINNHFNDQKTGVWVASRQSKDLKAFNCGDERIATDSVRYGTEKETTYHYEDFAKYNKIDSNTFINVISGVVVEDDETTIEDNTFSGTTTYDILIGTKYRTEALSRPVSNTTITNNQFNSSAPEKIKQVHTPVNTIIKDNTPEVVNN